MRVLATADIHIGRRPSAIGSADGERFSCAHVWLGVVQTAIEHQVDAILVAGDMVDQDNQFFEALAALEEGLHQLQEHGISVYAVSGNHDCEVLAQLADGHDAGNFRLLGRGGQWESVLLPNAERPEAQLFGWSFPRRYVYDSPLTDFPAHQIDNRLTVLGLLHTDRDGGDNHYAPVKTRELDGIANDIHWILGHIHAPEDVSPGTRAFYAGSPQGMDLGSSECGLHGPVLISMDAGSFSAKRLATAPVRYERPVFDFGAISSLNQVSLSFLQAVRDLVSTLVQSQPGLQILCIRPRCCYISPLRSDQIFSPLLPLLHDGEEVVVEGVRVHVDDLDIDLRPQVDLVELSTECGVLGQVAQVLLACEGNGDGGSNEGDLREHVHRRYDAILQAAVFSDLPVAEPLSEVSVGERILQRQAWRLLHELLLQRGSDVGT